MDFKKEDMGGGEECIPCSVNADKIMDSEQVASVKTSCAAQWALDHSYVKGLPTLMLNERDTAYRADNGRILRTTEKSTSRVNTLCHGKHKRGDQPLIGTIDLTFNSVERNIFLDEPSSTVNSPEMSQDTLRGRHRRRRGRPRLRRVVERNHPSAFYNYASSDKHFSITRSVNKESIILQKGRPPFRSIVKSREVNVFHGVDSSQYLAPFLDTRKIPIVRLEQLPKKYSVNGQVLQETASDQYGEINADLYTTINHENGVADLEPGRDGTGRQQVEEPVGHGLSCRHTRGPRGPPQGPGRGGGLGQHETASPGLVGVLGHSEETILSVELFENVNETEEIEGLRDNNVMSPRRPRGRPRSRPRGRARGRQHASSLMNMSEKDGVRKIAVEQSINHIEHKESPKVPVIDTTEEQRMEIAVHTSHLPSIGRAVAMTESINQIEHKESAKVPAIDTTEEQRMEIAVDTSHLPSISRVVAMKESISQVEHKESAKVPVIDTTEEQRVEIAVDTSHLPSIGRAVAMTESINQIEHKESAKVPAIDTTEEQRVEFAVDTSPVPSIDLESTRNVNIPNILSGVGITGFQPRMLKNGFCTRLPQALDTWNGRGCTVLEEKQSIRVVEVSESSGEDNPLSETEEIKIPNILSGVDRTGFQPRMLKSGLCTRLPQALETWNGRGSTVEEKQSIRGVEISESSDEDYPVNETEEMERYGIPLGLASSVGLRGRRGRGRGRGRGVSKYKGVARERIRGGTARLKRVGRPRSRRGRGRGRARGQGGGSERDVGIDKIATSDNSQSYTIEVTKQRQGECVVLDSSQRDFSGIFISIPPREEFVDKNASKSLLYGEGSKFPCKYCGMAFALPFYAEIHSKRCPKAPGNGAQVCSVCELVFKNISDLVNHMAMH